MGRLRNAFILGPLFVLIYIPLHAKTATNPTADPNSNTANGQPAGQAPDEMTKKIAELVHAGKYPEAQQLTTGLLVAYPEDQRLIKAKALIEKLLAPAGSISGVPTSNQPINTVAPLTYEFSKLDSAIKCVISGAGDQSGALFRGTIIDSGEIRWEILFFKEGWQPVTSWEFGDDKTTMKAVYVNRKNKSFEWSFTKN